MFVGKIKKDIRKAIDELLEENIVVDMLNNPKVRQALNGKVVEYEYLPDSKAHTIKIKFLF